MIFLASSSSFSILAVGDNHNLDLGQWLINDVFKLRGDEKYGVDLGEIYIQCRFLAAAETNSSVAA